MDTILSFFSHLILITAGLAVCVLWLAIFMVVAIEVHDLIFGDPSSATEDAEEENNYR